jgi:LysM repeat protein
MQKWLVTCIVLITCLNSRSFAQDEASVRRYIDQYKLLAVSEQKRSGIPAAITLAQGIHETQAGNSELAKQANNHFGIKCKKEWTGETFAHTDDAPDECFRKYKRAEDSYLDHSNYLSKTPRYANLFKLSVTDYAGWAFGLKQCGYATNPKYAHVLIKLIEDYHLQEFTYAAMENDLGSKYAIQTEVVPEHDAPAPDKTTTANLNAPGTPAIATLDAGAVIPPQTPIQTLPADSTTAPEPSLDGITVHKNIVVTENAIPSPSETSIQRPPYGQVVKINGLRAVYAKKGDMPLEYAIKNDLRYERLLEINEIDERPLPMDMFLYLERKNFRGVRPAHKVKEGETMFEIAQAEGIQLKSLRNLNMMQPDDEPETGTVLELQRQSSIRPAIIKKEIVQPNPPTPESTHEIAAIPEPVSALPETKTVEPDKTVQNDVVAENSQPAVEPKSVQSPVPEIVSGGDKAPAVMQNEPVTAPPVSSETAAVQNTVTTPPVPVGPPSSPNDIPAKPIEKPKVTEPIATVPQQTPNVTEHSAPEEPKSELDILKSKFDKVVYAKPKAEESAVPETQPKTETKPVEKEVVIASGTPKYYTVKKGDTAFSIAKANSITMRQLMDWNGLDFAEIKIGQKLRVQ